MKIGGFCAFENIKTEPEIFKSEHAQNTCHEADDLETKLYDSMPIHRTHGNNIYTKFSLTQLVSSDSFVNPTF